MLNAKELILLNTKVTDDVVSLKSLEGVALRSGTTINIDGRFRVTGRTKQGKVLATDMTANTLTTIETKDSNLKLVSRDIKKFKKVYEIVTKARLSKRVQAVIGLWND